MGYKMIQVATNTGFSTVSPFRQAITNIAGDSISFDDTLSAKRTENAYSIHYLFRFHITDVDVKQDSHGDNRVVIVTFNDGTTEKAVTSDNDTFNLEQGIQICIAKKAFSMSAFKGRGMFNKLVNNAVKLYKDKVTAAEKVKEETLKQEARAKKRAEKKARWLERKAAKEREARVSEMAEAYAKAMKMVNEDKND